MRKLSCIGMVLLAVFIFTGCATTTNMRQGGVMPGFLYGDGTYPSMKDSFTEFKYEAKDFDVLGTVTGQGESMNILFLVSLGDNGYQQLLRQAKEKYPDMDALINFYWDTKFFNIGWPYPTLPLYQRAQNIVTATVIKYKNKR